MKSFPLILLCFVCIGSSYGQGGRMELEITKAKHKTCTVKVIHSMITDSSVVRAVENRLKGFKPVKNRLKKGTYIVSVNFIVTRDGSAADVECQNDPGFGLCAEVLRELKKYGKWGTGEVKAAKR